MIRSSDVYFIPQDPEAGSDDVAIIDVEDGYQFDAITQHASTYSYQATRHPVSHGSMIADHMITAPFVWSASGMLTPYSQKSYASLGSLGLAAAASNDLAGINDAVSALNASYVSAIDRVNRRRDQLVRFAEEHIVLTVLGLKFQYSNMVITGLDIPETTDTRSSYTVTIRMERIRVAQTASNIGPITSVDAKKLGSISLKEFAG